MASQKYWFQQNSVEIKVARYQAQKKYQRRKNIGFDKIAWKLRWCVIKCRKNNGFTKISVLTK
jgi:N-acyl-L-homoserine lactone synthetase